MASPAAEVMASSAAAAADPRVAEPVLPGAAAETSTPSPKKRRVAPKIDIDAAIARHMADVKEAAKQVAQARKYARNEKRKKQRLMKKAASLTPEDLERIAVLKRCGLWQPSLDGVTSPSSENAAVASPASNVTAAAPPEAPAALPPPASAPPSEEGSGAEEPAEDGH